LQDDSIHGPLEAHIEELWPHLSKEWQAEHEAFWKEFENAFATKAKSVGLTEKDFVEDIYERLSPAEKHELDASARKVEIKNYNHWLTAAEDYKAPKARLAAAAPEEAKPAMVTPEMEGTEVAMKGGK
jgi:hypothetical protein